MTSRTSRRGSRGQALLELSLAAVLLVVLLVGSAQVGLLYYDQEAVATGAREAAVIAAENPGDTGLFAAPATPTNHTCTGSTDPIKACAAAFNSTHGGALGGLIDPTTFSVTLTGTTYSGSSPVQCAGNKGTSDGVVAAAVSYNAPVFVPFLNLVFSSPGHTYRTLSSQVTIRVYPCSVTSGG